MIKEIKKILLKEPEFPQNYGRMGARPELEEHYIWLTITKLCNLNKGKYLKHFIRDKWKETNTPKHDACGLKIPTGTLTTHLHLFMEV